MFRGSRPPKAAVQIENRLQGATVGFQAISHGDLPPEGSVRSVGDDARDQNCERDQNLDCWAVHNVTPHNSIRTATFTARTARINNGFDRER